MKLLKKPLLFWSLIAGACLLVAVLGMRLKNVVLRGVTVRLLAQVTGFDVTMGGMDVGLLNPHVEIKDLRFRNPPDFPAGDALEVRHLLVRYDRRSLFAREIHLPEIALDIPHVQLVRRADGSTNLDGMGGGPEKIGRLELPDFPGQQRHPTEPPGEPPPVERPGGEAAGPGEPEPAEGSSGGEPRPEREPRTVKIDKLSMKLGDVEVKDYSRGGPEPSVLHMQLGVDREFDDVTDLQTVAGMIAAEVMVKSMPLLVDEVDKLLKEGSEELGIDEKELKGALQDLLKQLGM
jgi:hypothetical protein